MDKRNDCPVDMGGSPTSQTLLPLSPPIYTSNGLRSVPQAALQQTGSRSNGLSPCLSRSQGVIYSPILVTYRQIFWTLYRVELCYAWDFLRQVSDRREEIRLLAVHKKAELKMTTAEIMSVFSWARKVRSSRLVAMSDAIISRERAHTGRL